VKENLIFFFLYDSCWPKFRTVHFSPNQLMIIDTGWAFDK
jgi:hypothetical protein